VRDLWDTIPEPDVCAAKHGGADTSCEAFARAQASMPMARAAVLALVRDAGMHGITLAEACEIMGKEKNCISGRFSELQRDKLIHDSGRRRDGCRVWVARETVFPAEDASLAAPPG
jgi:hypothetical protein